MPEYQYAGTQPMTYPDSKDSHGIPVGEAEPGDTRDLDAPLDGDWVPVQSRPAKPAAKDKAAPAVTDKAGAPGSKEG